MPRPLVPHVVFASSLINLHTALSWLQKKKSNDVLLAGHCLINDHTRNPFAIRFLLRCVDAVVFRVYCQAVHFLLNWKVFQLAVVVGVVHLEYRDGSA